MPAVAARVVSLDYCADQFVLELLDPDRILAVSPDASAEFSWMRSAAAGVPTVRPRAEDVLILEPDLVVRSYGGGPNARAFFERAGVPVVQIGFATGIEDVRATIRRVSAALGVPERGAKLVAEMNRRLAAIPRGEGIVRALYTTPSGTTAGPGTLVGEMLTAAGLENFQVTPGWRSLPLERLAYERPGIVAAAFFGARTSHDDAWTASRHPVARRSTAEATVAALDGAATSCGGWFLVDAVEVLAEARERAVR